MSDTAPYCVTRNNLKIKEKSAMNMTPRWEGCPVDADTGASAVWQAQK
ncbi:hypothetical protein SAMN05216196_10372 [Lutimaribacter pacificus]|uniref:Uncharacterized protein n=1 Tax=Lutimaribacter pacificus TaxID=391948 RepID=A0A1H0G303_9RHOB|nr:hypothetical protein SAMN05216196_10372 [Lutimaribacter pacificus]SHJ84424.1 hypothetical protein SAMN05444142_10273 [Lutimaribacter pacificus]